MKKRHRESRYPAIDKAVAFVNEMLDNGRWLMGKKLPAIRSMAQDAGVSRGAMARALLKLKAQGLISGLARHRLTAGAISPADRPESQRLAQWQRKQTLLEKDIISGAFGFAGPLPPLKELQARYGVCFRTMQKILRSMNAEGIVKQSGKGYALHGIVSQVFRQRIVFVTCLSYFAQRSALNHDRNNIVNYFEKECMRIGVEFEIVEVDFSDPAANWQGISGFAGIDTISGFIYDVWDGGTEIFQRSVLDVLTRLAAFNKPITILDEIGNFSLPLQLVHNQLIQVYRIESIRAGERAARFLLGLGHRSVAYISQVHVNEWSQDRFAGIKKQFARAGFDNGVHLFAAEPVGGLPDILALSGLGEGTIHRLVPSIGLTPAQAADVQNSCKRIMKTGLPLSIRDHQTVAALQTNLAPLEYILKRRINGDFIEGMCKGALEASALQVFAMSLRPVFEKALADHTITAWICATDDTAFMALHFLKPRKIAVPSYISIVGFDNVPVQALQMQLTTFDFNAAGFVSQMLNFLLRPPKPRGQYRHSAIEVEGMIMKRATTGRARNT